jgi:excisionase family DNA binding protein
MENWLTLKEVSAYLKVPVSKIQSLMQEGKIPFHDKHGILRFSQAEIDAWLFNESTPVRNDQQASSVDNDFSYRGKPIKSFALTASKILIGDTAFTRFPEFIRKSINALKDKGRVFLYREEFIPFSNNYMDYLRVCCQLGLIDNLQEDGRRKRYYPTEYAQRIYAEEDDKRIKKIILESILDIARKNIEMRPGQRHSVYLLWYFLNIKAMGIVPNPSHFDKGEYTAYPVIRYNFTMSLCNYLFEGDENEEQNFLNEWNKFM